MNFILRSSFIIQIAFKTNPVTKTVQPTSRDFNVYDTLQMVYILQKSTLQITLHFYTEVIQRLT